MLGAWKPGGMFSGRVRIWAIKDTAIALPLSVVFSLIAIGVHSVVDFNLYVPANGLLAVCLAGILVSHYDLRQNPLVAIILVPPLPCPPALCRDDWNALNFLPSRWASDYWENGRFACQRIRTMGGAHGACCQLKPGRYDLLQRSVKRFCNEAVNSHLGMRES